MDALLDAAERRILGVLIEKALATPEYYPMTVNALVAGCNQKSNRDPISTHEDWEVEGALQSMRNKGWAEPADGGGRATKWRHKADTRLGLDRAGLAVLAELLLRGPQQPGELRGRASRMCDLPTQESLQNVLDRLAHLMPPVVRRLPRVPGERADRYGQTLGPGSTAEAPADADSPPASAVTPVPPSGHDVTALEARVTRLEQALAELRARLDAEGPTPKA